MDLLNGAARFGAVSKFFHWAVFLLFVNQYATGILMMRLERGHLVLGFAQGDYYTWHKSVGLLVLALVLLRITWRKTTRLPDWPATLAPWEQGCMKWTERALYACMFVMPVSGYVFTLAGGYNFKLFGLLALPQVIAKNAAVATAASVTRPSRPAPATFFRPRASMCSARSIATIRTDGARRQSSIGISAVPVPISRRLAPTGSFRRRSSQKRTLTVLWSIAS